jgi:hypothetical protein
MSYEQNVQSCKEDESDPGNELKTAEVLECKTEVSYDETAPKNSPCKITDVACDQVILPHEPPDEPKITVPARPPKVFDREYSSVRVDTADQSDVSAIVSTTRLLLDADFDDLVDGERAFSLGRP